MNSSTILTFTTFIEIGFFYFILENVDYLDQLKSNYSDHYSKFKSFKKIDEYITEGLKIARIFIVDDCKYLVKIFETFLTIKGHEVVAKAFDGNQAIELYHRPKIPHFNGL
ncbi:MAG: hypothetical protein ACFFCZ_23355 [Promethearchaeota archaeon]